MKHTQKKETFLKNIETALRHIYSLTPDNRVLFNNQKTRLNGQADLVTIQNMTYTYFKVFCSYEQCFYSVSIDHFKKITESDYNGYVAKDLDHVILANEQVFTIIDINTIKNYNFFKHQVNGITNLVFPYEQFKNYYYDGRVFVQNGIPSSLPRDKDVSSLKGGYLIDDHRLGKLYTFIDNNSLKGGGNGNVFQKDVNDYVNAIYGATTEDNVKSKASFNKRVRRHIDKTVKQFSKGEKLEPLTGIFNNESIEVFIFPVDMISVSNNRKLDLTSFFQYQNSHEAHKNKTEDMKEYQKNYVASHDRKEYFDEYNKNRQK